MPAAAQRGLTLVELLVTLLLVGLAASLVTGGISQAGGLLARVTADQGLIYDELMARAWLRQSIEAAVPPLGDEQEFMGGPAQLRLRSFRPLLGSEGVPTTLAWQATAQGGLEYLEGEQQMRIDALPPLIRIEYQDAQLAWHDEWPVGEEQGLPVRVGFVFAGEDDRLDVTLRARRAAAGGDDDDDTDYDEE